MLQCMLTYIIFCYFYVILRIYKFIGYYSARFLPWERFWDTYFKGSAYSEFFRLSTPEGTILKVGTNLSIYDTM